MKRARLLWIAAWVMQAVAWFARVDRDGVALPDGLPGWQAWWLSTGTVLHIHAGDAPAWYNVVLCGVSSLTTVLFLLVAPFIFSKAAGFLRKCAWIALASWIINIHWMFLFSPRSDLRAGYYLWWLSFGVLSAALFAKSGEASNEAPPKSNAASA